MSLISSIQDVNFSRHDTIAIISMSGTKERYEMITHDNILNTNEMQMFEGKTFLSFKSWNVYAEISNLLATTIMGGTRIVTRERFNCKLTREIVGECNVDLLQLTAYQMQQMRPATVTGNYFENLERVLCTGPKINEPLIKYSAVCFPNSTFTPHLLHGSSAPSTPVSPIGQKFIRCGTPVPGMTMATEKAKGGFLKGIFRKKQKSVEL